MISTFPLARYTASFFPSQHPCVPILKAFKFGSDPLKIHGQNSLKVKLLLYSTFCQSPGGHPECSTKYLESLLSLAAFCCRIVGSTISHPPCLQVLWSMQRLKLGSRPRQRGMPSLNSFGSSLYASPALYTFKHSNFNGHESA